MLVGKYGNRILIKLLHLSYEMFFYEYSKLKFPFQKLSDFLINSVIEVENNTF